MSCTTSSRQDLSKALCNYCGHAESAHKPDTFMAYDPKLGKRRKYEYQDCRWSVTMQVDGDTITNSCLCGLFERE
jgi:hypothetical protein